MTSGSLKATATTGPEYLWRNVLAFKGGEFTVRDLQKRCRSHKIDALRSALRRFVAAGLVQARGARKLPGNNAAARVYVCVKPHARPPAFSSATSKGVGGRRQYQLWTSMRTLRSWTVEELALRASHEDFVITEACARGYVWSLVKAGVVMVVAGRRTLEGGGTTAAVYRLNPRRNTGPEAPEVHRSKGGAVYDPNRRAYVVSAPTEEVSA